jgi:hypothetical protein
MDLLFVALGMAGAGAVCVWTIAAAWLRDRAGQEAVLAAQRERDEEVRMRDHPDHVVGFILVEPLGERVVAVRMPEEAYEALMSMSGLPEEGRVVLSVQP